jgi:nitrite reductase/ring-hydroxylating ferredoxin subunit
VPDRDTTRRLRIGRKRRPGLLGSAGVERSVAKTSDLAEGKTLKFRFRESGEEKEAFLVRRDGRFFAYRNECRHIPMTMDWVENRFLSRDRCYIQCATHGALYEIDTGLCVSGPPAGERLRRLDVEVRGDDVVVTLPEE